MKYKRAQSGHCGLGQGKLEKMNSKPARSEIRVATARFWWPLLLMAPAEQAPAP